MTRPLPPEWQCPAAGDSDCRGHTLVPGRKMSPDVWGCSRCDRVVPCASVDALALMLDGTCAVMDGDHAHADRVWDLEDGLGGDLLTMRLASGMRNVAEAILELEGAASRIVSGLQIDGFTPFSLADRALCKAIGPSRILDVGDITQLLEAAALLRDGWRPGGES